MSQAPGRTCCKRARAPAASTIAFADGAAELQIDAHDANIERRRDARVPRFVMRDGRALIEHAIRIVFGDGNGDHDARI